ncbi:MAG: adenosylcobinamide-GDP ribazoletransferase [Lachnospiraceae bacterium]|nr:adenosylcobinamide-GDP ribazoletransferase [Lachnospiraceae bacterium]
MKQLQSLVVAMAMYSKIPMPRIDWNDDNMRFALCYFPVAGLACGLILSLWGYLAFQLPLGAFFKAVVFVLIPIFVTGGIHMDGYMDTVDALSSWGDREKKLAILKDSHSGAFAILFCGVYLFAATAIWSEMISFTQVLVLAVGFAYTRAMSGFGIARFKSARKNGMVASFNSMADSVKAGRALFIEAVVFAALMIFINVPMGVAAVVTGFAVFAYGRHMAYKTFGGTTGDIQGFTLQVAELLMALAVMIIGKVL